MPLDPHLANLAAKAAVKDQYQKQLNRLRSQNQQTDRIEEAVKDALENLPIAKSGSLVIYGDPQSGKTEMMICLTARLLDEGEQIIVHLLNDSVDLLTQNLGRFRKAGLAPAPRNAIDLVHTPLVRGHSAILFCKKNVRDLGKLIAALKGAPVIVIDDEADYATPNAKINKQEKTKINERVEQLLGQNGKYIGVTATPARLNLNNTFDNRPETWVQFHPHAAYTGQDTFFPQKGAIQFRLTKLAPSASPIDAHRALARFLVTVAHLNTNATSRGEIEENYSMLVHTSGSTADHAADRQIFESIMSALIGHKGRPFEEFVQTIHNEAKLLYPKRSADELTTYVLVNASRSSVIVLNSTRDRASAGENPTQPTTPFTVIIGGNIVSRGVTFPNLLSMFFTRDVKTKLQQDTYIQRARMFGARGKYLPHFELTIPTRLYADWQRCFDFHRLALEAIRKNNASPVWIGDARISIASSSSIDRATVDMSKGEMAFRMFPSSDPTSLDAIVDENPVALKTLRKLHERIGDALPQFLIDYIDASLTSNPGTLAIHRASSIANYANSADVDNIARTKGFIGRNQLEAARFPNAVHHVKVFYNDKKKARVFYKNTSGVQFVQNLR